MSALEKLAKHIRNRADALDLTDPESLPEAATTGELLRVLARMLEGKSWAESFGAPGHWGYATPIGANLYAALKEGGGR